MLGDFVGDDEGPTKRQRWDIGAGTADGLPSEAEILKLVAQRESHRQARRFAESDSIREELRSMGVELFDKEKEWRCRDGRRGMLFTAGPQECALSDHSIQDLISQRDEARRAKDWGRADLVRDELRRSGVELDDRENTWRTASGRSGTYSGIAAQPRQQLPGSLGLHGAGLAGMSSGRQLRVQAEGAGTLGVTAIRKLVAERERLRASQDFEAADELRRQLANLGVEIFDNERVWRSTDGHQGVIITGGHEATVGCLLSDMDIMQRVTQREQARNAKDFGQADAIRDELRRQGVELLDAQKTWSTAEGRQGGYNGSMGVPMMTAPAYPAALGGFAPVGAISQPMLLQQPSLVHQAMANQSSATTFTTASIAALVSGRERARDTHDWEAADAIRADLRGHGVEVWDKEKVWRANDGRSGSIQYLQ